MARDTGIAARLRAAGLKVEEVAGWQTRGSSTFNPQGLVYHHTAGSRTGNAPSLGICVNGRTGLPGPLCHVLIGRDNTCYVIAAGKANHAGLGGWNGLSGNSTVYGIEHENVGTTAEPWRPDQIEVAARAARALMDGRPVAKVCLHKEWAPTRKIDPHSISGHQFRSAVANTPPAVDPNPKDEHMSAEDVQQLSDRLDRAVQILGTGDENKAYSSSKLPWVAEVKGLSEIYAKVHGDTWGELQHTNIRLDAVEKKLDAILAAVKS